MTKLTNEEIAARIKASQMKNSNRVKHEKINNSEALERTGLRIIHFNNNFAPMTVAYKQINKSHVKVATAVCHSADTFTKKIGTQIAIKNFEAGNTIILPCKNQDACDLLLDMLGNYY